MASTSPQKMAPPILPGQYSRVTSNQHAAADAYGPVKPAYRVHSEGSTGSKDAVRGRSQVPRSSPDKENNPNYAVHAPASPTKQSKGFSLTKSKPVVDPKYRLRGNSPEDTNRAPSSSKLNQRRTSSQSPSKGKARSRSRSRFFGKERAASPELSDAPRTKEQIDADFVQLLDEMQVAPDVRRKLLSLDATVKASMLKGQATLTLSGFGFDDSTSGSPTKSRQPIPFQMRKTKSSANLKEALGEPNGGAEGNALEPPNRSQIFGGRNLRSASGGSVGSGSDSSSRDHTKRGSVDLFQGLRGGIRSPNLGQGGSALSLQSTNTTATGRQRTLSFGKELSAQIGKETPETFATILKAADARRLDVAKVKRMRAVVASESPAWISQFIDPECGGYDAMLVRLDELLKMEWREEQHDDMLLHELLRCFVALSTTEVGRGALQQRAPTPFKELVDLLFSDKKPGELGTRKLMVELVALVLDLQLPATTRSASSSLNFLLQLLQNPIDPAKEAVVDFIKQTHTPRPFKVYLTEVASVCRDYFWIFCHSQNRYWCLEDLDAETIKGPKVPGGMTGGVEFEAMGYLTTHFRLINSVAAALARPVGHGSVAARPDMSAYDFHSHLFASGMERIIAHLRRSSQHYYSPMHLELARYISLATAARFTLPHHITDWIAPSKKPETQQSYRLDNVVNTGYGFAGQVMHSLVPARMSSVQEQVQEQQPLAQAQRSDLGGMRPISGPTDGRPSQPATYAAELDKANPGRSSPTKEVAPVTSPSKHHYASGRWLAGGGASRAEQHSPLPAPAPPLVVNRASPSPSSPSKATFPNPYAQAQTQPTHAHAHADLAPPRPAGRAAQDSVVGSAIKKWESLAGAAPAVPNAGRAGLGLGWAAAER